jgi:nicotinamidase-related amidase
MLHDLSAYTMELSNAIPYVFQFRPESTALVIIDMQRDFLEPGGFGSIQCGDDTVFNSVRKIVPVVQRVLEASRKLGLYVMHTREGHFPDLSDLPASKRLRQMNAPNGHHTIGIGETGPMGRLLIRGEYGHDIIDELRPLPGEVVIDKPGKGSFWRTDFHRSLLNRGITHLLLAGVTTE